MTTETNNKPDTLPPETQKQRWVKYGANVALTVVVVVLLGVAITYLAQRYARRLDTTASGMYSLKPQTVNLIKDLKQKVKLVSLYQARDPQGKENPEAGPVRDLLEEYSRKGKNIEYDVIDPITQPTKVDALVSEAVNKYGGATKAYKDFLDEFNKTHAQLTELARKESQALADAPAEIPGDDDRSQNVAAIIATVRDTIPKALTRLKERTDRALKAGKYPDYRVIVDFIKDQLDVLSQREGAIERLVGQYKDDANVPEPIRKYFADAGPRHAEVKKLIDDTTKKIESLGELKVGELQQAMKGQDLILVLGENDWKVVDYNQVWKAPDTRELRNFTDVADIKPRFAGEQAVTTAILNVTSGNKQKVAFVRTGGPPLTAPGFPPFTQGGPFSEVADRLRGYNFEVVEKDLSGMWAMQAQMQQQPSAPEPSDEEIKNALWVLIALPANQRMGPAPSVGPALARHLAAGGSAMVMALNNADTLSDALKDYGVELLTDVIIVHDVPKGDRARSNDYSEDLQRLPFVFVTNNPGDHLLTQPIKSLDVLLANPLPVKTTPTPGVKITPLLPIPQVTKTWGERDLESTRGENLKFDESGPGADLPGPFWSGAAVEKGGSRLVVFGTLQSFTNDVLLRLPDVEMAKRGIPVARFPGNGELFTNAVFWLTKMEPMIAISPAAMQVSRIGTMSEGVLNTWRIGVLLILLPGAILAAGIWMYFARRD